jgi:hypothetical protein
MLGGMAKKRSSKLAVVTSSVLFVVFLSQLVTSLVWARWFAVRHDDVTYNIVSAGGTVVLQRAHLYEPITPGWTCVRGACVSGRFGPVTPSSAFEDFGLVDTVIRIPMEVSGPPEVASAMQTTGRSITIPVLLLLALAGVLPLKHLEQRRRSRRLTRQRGFDVTVVRGNPN